MSQHGILIAAPGSGCGKTLVTLALLRLLRRKGVDVAPAKSGPDYIDPGFHAVAAGCDSFNLDAFAMRPALIRQLAGQRQGMLVVEGAMGLFDGAADGNGSAADLATLLGMPVVLVVDAARQAQSAAALLHGFASYRASVSLGGVILNRVASARHEAMLRQALEPLGIPVLAALPVAENLAVPSRHLGLVLAAELPAIDRFAEDAADWLEARLDLPGLQRVAAKRVLPSEEYIAHALPPLGQKIAIASDEAFSFAYPHLLAEWRRAGAELAPFSPLADQAPACDADAIYLPGGYPELHAGQLAQAAAFRAGMHEAAASGALIYGECGGYMVLGDGIKDADGTRHAMLGLLPLETDFQQRKRHLGYRRIKRLYGRLPWPDHLMAHEFHYASIVSEGGTQPLFHARDAVGNELGGFGQVQGGVLGSFLHVIDGGAHD